MRTSGSPAPQIVFHALIVSVLLLALPLAAQAVNLPPNAAGKVGPGVAEQLQETGSVQVMIALQRSARPAAPGLELAAEKARISEMQVDVLARLSAADYASRHAYSAVPALAGRIRSEAGLAAIARNPHVVRVDLDQGGTGHLVNSVPVIAADLRHAVGNTGTGIVVAVLDSGLDTDHDNLSDDLLFEACFADDDGTINGAGRCPNGSDRQTGPGAAEDDAGHGSHVSGIVTSNGTQGGVGVAPDAGIVALKVTYGPSFSGAFSFFSEIVAALDYIIANPDLGVDVINMSVGTNALFTGDCDAATAGAIAGAAAIDTLRAGGVTTFASAGNNSSTTQMPLPACLSNVISVGASDNSDVAAAFTNSNASTDIFAPGVNVVSADLLNATRSASGTSMASPHAAGCAALLIEAGDATTPDQIEALLESSPFTVAVAGNGLTFPRIDCSTFVNIAPSCDANGPYLAECAVAVQLDGSGSEDLNGDALSYLWTGSFEGGSANGAMPFVTFASPTGNSVVTLTVDDGLEDAQCQADVTVVDTTPPSITPPADVTEECASPDGTAVALGTPSASDSCDPNPAISNDAPALFDVGETQVIWTATDDDLNTASAGQLVTVVDTTPPELFCNAPPTITPPDAPIAFTATAADQCQGPLTPAITAYDCYKSTKKGKIVGKTNSCVVSIEGDQITILDTGGVADMITWTVEATDDAGNTASLQCELEVVNPAL